MEVETHILSNLGAAPDLSYAIAAELRGTSEKVRCKKNVSLRDSFGLKHPSSN